MARRRRVNLFGTPHQLADVVVMAADRQGHSDDDAGDDERDPTALCELLDHRHHEDSGAHREAGE